jgi:hypothetical protein
VAVSLRAGTKQRTQRQYSCLCLHLVSIDAVTLRGQLTILTIVFNANICRYNRVRAERVPLLLFVLPFRTATSLVAPLSRETPICHLGYLKISKPGICQHPAVSKLVERAWRFSFPETACGNGIHRQSRLRFVGQSPGDSLQRQNRIPSCRPWRLSPRLRHLWHSQRSQRGWQG